ncbi:hypothetical protein [Virgibacillus proomii]|uniref:hypothetical protein n=1 Tax=Virgibacillus proomii TaxID=84407 RepID=UPI0009849508|nr:hypothetical protein [Virgibacillus proomii]
MEIETYSNNDKGDLVKVFFSVDSNNNVESITVGNQVVPVGKGFQFYVKNYVAEQIDKTELIISDIFPKLKVREGEEIEVPTEEQQKQKEIEELERKLKELRGEEDVPNE